MQPATALLTLLAASSAAPVALAVRSRYAAVAVGSAGTDPLAKTLELLRELAAKIEKAGDNEAKGYRAYFEWCDEVTHNVNYEIKSQASQKAKLEAKISDLGSRIDMAASKIDDLASETSSSEQDLKDADLVREKEVAEFTKSESELLEVIDSLERAASVLEREMQKGSAALAQLDTSSVQAMLRSLGTVADAASLSGSDRRHLLALLESQRSAEQAEAAGELGAPAAAAYGVHFSSILDTLEDLKDKSEAQLSELRDGEANAKHAYNLMKQSVEDKIAADKKDMEEEKSAKDQAAEAKARAEGDLEVTLTGLRSSEEDLAAAKSNCIRVAADHEASVKAREEELRVISKATRLLGSTSSAGARTYALLQFGAASSSRSHAGALAGAARSQLLGLIRKLAQQHHSAALATLASRISAVMRYGTSNSVDWFAKAKELIQDLVRRLERELSAEASELVYCGQELKHAASKRGELEETLSEVTTRIDQFAAKSADLKAEVKELQSELAAVAKQQAEMEWIRQEAHEEYVQAKADLEAGLASVRQALRTLRDYYANEAEPEAAALVQEDASFSADMRQSIVPKMHEKSTASSGIIALLEVVESDFGDGLTKQEIEEADEQAGHDKMSEEIRETRTLMNKDVEYKTAEFQKLDKSLTELVGDKGSSEAELAAVVEYHGKLKERCMSTDSYEEGKKRREAEIRGLQDALAVLENHVALLQRTQHSGNIRRTVASP